MTELCVCIGSSCHINGAYNVQQTFQQLIEQNGLNDLIEFKGTFCLKQCSSTGVSVTLNGEKYNIPADSARSFFNEKVLPFVKKN